MNCWLWKKITCRFCSWDLSKTISAPVSRDGWGKLKQACYDTEISLVTFCRFLWILGFRIALGCASMDLCIPAHFFWVQAWIMFSCMSFLYGKGIIGKSLTKALSLLSSSFSLFYLTIIFSRLNRKM